MLLFRKIVVLPQKSTFIEVFAVLYIRYGNKRNTVQNSDLSPFQHKKVGDTIETRLF